MQTKTKMSTTTDYRAKVEAAWKRSRFGAAGVYTLAECDAYQRPKPQHGDSWGSWILNLENISLEYKGTPHTFDLEYVPPFNHALHFIGGKSWMTVEDAGNLMFAISDLFADDHYTVEKHRAALAEFRKRGVQ